LIRPHYSSDITLLGEIALRGKVVELPEFLFFRRFDRDSATSLQDPRIVQQYHFPTPGIARYFQTWRRCWGLGAAVCRAELTLSQRARGLRFVAGTWHSALPRLYAEVKEALAAMLGRRAVSAR
jgi:hypothetical protein